MREGSSFIVLRILNFSVLWRLIHTARLSSRFRWCNSRLLPSPVLGFFFFKGAEIDTVGALRVNRVEVGDGVLRLGWLSVCVI